MRTAMAPLKTTILVFVHWGEFYTHLSHKHDGFFTIHLNPIHYLRNAEWICNNKWCMNVFRCFSLLSLWMINSPVRLWGTYMCPTPEQWIIFYYLQVWKWLRGGFAVKVGTSVYISYPKQTNEMTQLCWLEEVSAPWQVAVTSCWMTNDNILKAFWFILSEFTKTCLRHPGV